MNTNRLVFTFLACLTSLCLAGESLISSAAAASIVVTTNQDVVDSPFNADGLCGSGGTVANLPGADDKISLREAIIAANNTPGQKTIKFNLIPSDRTIVLTRFLALCGGHTTLNGDVDGDTSPDITLDGRAVPFPFDVLDIFSSHNTVKSLRVLASGVPGTGGIGIAPTPAVSTTLIDNMITHNIVLGGYIFVFPGFDFSNPDQPFDGGTVKYVRVRNNTVSNAPGAGIGAGIFGDHHEMTEVTIAGNTVSGNTIGIVALGGGAGTTDNRLEVTIKDNLVTGNSNPGDTAGIAILGGADSSSNNQVTAEVLNNTVTDNDGRGISATASIFGGADNHIDVTVRENTVTDNSTPGDTAGISILGGFSSSPNNQVNAQLLHNTITNNNGNGISAGSGNENSSNNDVAVTIRDNLLENNAGAGIVTYGAIGTLSPFSSSGDSSDNILDARIERNTVTNAFVFGIWVLGGLGSFDGALTKVANNNAVTAVVKDNTVSGTFGDGINLAAGASGVTNDNEVDVTVRKNTVCGGGFGADIHAIGGLQGNPFLPDNLGTGNELVGDITKNTASTVVVEDGVVGNSANVIQAKNVPCP